MSEQRQQPPPVAELIGLPLDYLGKDGSCMTDEDPDGLIRGLWGYHKCHNAEARRTNTYGPFDEKAKRLSLLQKRDVRDGLKAAVQSAFYNSCRMAAMELGVRYHNQPLVRNDDLVSYINSLPCTKENAKQLYEIVYSWDHGAIWETKLINEYLAKDGYYLLRPRHAPTRRPGIKTTDPQLTNSGFGALVRAQLGDVIKGLFRTMLTKTGWKIAGTDRAYANMDKSLEYQPMSFKGQENAFNLITRKGGATVSFPRDYAMIS